MENINENLMFQTNKYSLFDQAACDIILYLDFVIFLFKVVSLTFYDNYVPHVLIGKNQQHYQLLARNLSVNLENFQTLTLLKIFNYILVNFVRLKNY
jgi:hypothetical protein